MKPTQTTPRIVGQTKDAGFQIGVRKTFAISSEQAWEAITSDVGIKLWLGDVSGLRFEKGAPYQTKDGAKGEFRVVNPGGHLRLTWQPPGWPKASTIQIRVIPNGAKTVISFHQEHLPGAKEREQMRQRWQEVLAKLQKIVQS